MNYANQRYEYGWRINLGLAAVPALLVIVGAALAPETPTFLAARGANDQVRTTLQKIRGVEGEACCACTSSVCVRACACMRISQLSWLCFSQHHCGRRPGCCCFGMQMWRLSMRI